MGRHSAPDDTDEDVEPGGGSAIAVATESADAAGRHAHRAGARPRPVPDPGPRPDEPDSEDGPPVEGLSLLDDAWGPEPAGVHTAADAPTTEISLVDVARHDRALSEETTIKIAAVAEAPIAGIGTGTGIGIGADTDGPDAADVASPPASAEGRPPTAAPASGGRATTADLALIRAHADVRARVIAAVIAPFTVFVAVFAVRGDLDVHSLVWIWIPAVVAGVLVGALLDAGHKRYAGEHKR